MGKYGTHKSIRFTGRLENWVKNLDNFTQQSFADLNREALREFIERHGLGKEYYTYDVDNEEKEVIPKNEENENKTRKRKKPKIDKKKNNNLDTNLDNVDI